MSTFKERLQELIGERSAAAFARQCGLPPTSIRGYLLSNEPNLENLVRIAERSGVMLDWLALGMGVKLRADAAAVDVVKLLEEYAKGPMTPERLFEVMVIQVSHIQDPVLREKAMRALVQREDNLPRTTGKRTPKGNRKQS